MERESFGFCSIYLKAASKRKYIFQFHAECRRFLFLSVCFDVGWHSAVFWGCSWLLLGVCGARGTRWCGQPTKQSLYPLTWLRSGIFHQGNGNGFCIQCTSGTTIYLNPRKIQISKAGMCGQLQNVSVSQLTCQTPWIPSKSFIKIPGWEALGNGFLERIPIRSFW